MITVEPKINIIGYGFVGNAIGHLCNKNKLNYSVYDIIKKNTDHNLNFCNTLKDLVYHSENDLVQPLRGTFMEVINFYFICVPTPSTTEGDCNTLIVENVISELTKFVKKKTVIIIKSTLKPGTSQILNKTYISEIKSKYIDIVFCPEFLKEISANDDMYNSNFSIFGINESKDNKYLINNLTNLFENYLYKHKKEKSFVKILGIKFENKFKVNTPLQIITRQYQEAELFKYTINTFLAIKVYYFNEIYELCNELNIDYQHFKTLFPLEPRLGNYGTIVPGFHGHKFAGNCLIKDCAGMRQLQKSLNIPSVILDEILKRNKQIGDLYPS